MCAHLPGQGFTATPNTLSTDLSTKNVDKLKAGARPILCKTGAARPRGKPPVPLWQGQASEQAL